MLKEIIIDWSLIQKIDDFYESFFDQVKAPSWHGRNLNALSDSLVAGSINEIEPPYKIINKNLNSTTEELVSFQEALQDIYLEAISSERKIEVINFD